MSNQGQYFMHTNAIIQMAVKKLSDAFHWRSFDEIASGTFSKVYRVSYEKHKYFSLKIEPAVNQEILEMIDKQEREGFRMKSKLVSEMIEHEIETMKELSSGEGSIYVVKYVDDWKLELEYMKYRIPCYVILMEYVQGVKFMLQEVQRFTLPQTLKLGIDVGFALKYLHTKNQVHNDIKVSNIFYAKDLHSYKLGDYSIATNYQNEMVLGGSIGYMAPEVRRYMEDRNNPFPDTKKSDIYSFGMMLYKLLNGNQFPYGEDYAKRLYQPDRDYDLPAIEELPEELNRIINKACRCQPEERYESVNDMLVDLSNLYVQQNQIHNTDDRNTITTYMPSVSSYIDDMEDTNIVPEIASDPYEINSDLASEVKFLDSIINGAEQRRRKRNSIIALSAAAAVLIAGIVLVVANLSNIYLLIGDSYYQNGNIDSAIEWYEKAEEAGKQSASGKMAQVYRDDGIRQLKAENFDGAITALLQAKEMGIPTDQKFKNYLSDAYIGRGAALEKKKDYDAAEEDYLKAYELGNQEACYPLGMLYCNTDNKKANAEKALTYLEEAQKNGNTKAAATLTKLYNSCGDESYKNKKYAAASEYYQKSAALEDAYGQYRLGRCYYEGYGTDADYQKAVEWLTKAAEQNQKEAMDILPEAEYALANQFFRKEDYGNALYYATLSAEAGNADAQYQTGVIYYYGYGVDTDYEEAIQWFEQAAKQGNTQADRLLSRACIAAGKEAYQQEQYEQAMSYYSKLQYIEDKEVLYQIGCCYYHGNGTKQDLEQACSYLIEAEDAGSKDAKKLLPELLYEQGKACYLAGKYKDAFAYYSESSDRGYLDADYAVYYCYKNGRGVKKNYAYAAALWLEFIGNGGDSDNSEYAYFQKD